MSEFDSESGRFVHDVMRCISPTRGRPSGNVELDGRLLRDQVGDAERQNEKLVGALQDAKQQIELLNEEVDKLCAPPNSYGVFMRTNKDGILDGKQSRPRTRAPTSAGSASSDTGISCSASTGTRSRSGSATSPS